MRSIKINNPVLNSYITDIATDYVPATSTTNLTVKSTNSFAANDLVVFGNPTEELTELKKLSSISSITAAILASALNFSHNKGTPLYKSIWDYVSIEGRSDSNGVFAELTSSPIQWDSKINKTIYFHQAGTDTWQYRFRFYNSVTTTYSEYSPTQLGIGFTKFQMGYIIRKARIMAGDRSGKILNEDELLESATLAKNIIRAHNARYWFWRVDGFQSGKSIAATATNDVYSLSSITDLGVIDYIEYQFNNGSQNTKWALRKKTDIEMASITRDQNGPSNNNPHYFRLMPPDSNSSKGYFQVEAKIKDSSIGTFYPHYYKEEDDYNSQDDATAIIIPQILQDYLTAEIYAAKGNDTAAKRYYDRFSGPEGRQKTLALDKLSGIALLDALDKQYKESQGQPTNLWNFRGQKGISKLFGSRSINTPDYYRENYFDSGEY